MIEKIENHISEALEKLIEQYKGSEKINALITSLVSGFQEIEISSCDLYGRLDVLNATGESLDKIGEIVGQKRLGNEDSFYRTLILTRIGINLSNGQPETIIDTFKVLSGASIVHLQEYFDGAIGIYADAELEQEQLQFTLNLLNKVLPSGVRIAHLGTFDPECQFAFDGDVENTQGFGSVNDPNIGGCFAKVYIIGNPFAFEGSDSDADGFGSVFDPLVGGLLESNI